MHNSLEVKKSEITTYFISEFVTEIPKHIQKQNSTMYCTYV